MAKNEGSPRGSLDVGGVVNSIWNNGLLLSFLSGITVSLTSLMVKLITNTTFLQITFYRSIVIGCFMFTWCSLRGDKPRELLLNLPIRTMGWLLARSVSSFVAVASMFAAYQHIPMGDAAAILGATPAFTGLMGVVLIGEAWQRKHVYLTVLAWSGIAFIYKPQFLLDILPFDDSLDEKTDYQSTNKFYMGVALLVPVTASLSFIVSRKFSHLPSQLIIGLTFFGSAVYSCLAMIFSESLGMPTLADWKFLIPEITLGAMTQSLLGRALQREKAAPVTLMRNSSILASFIMQYALFGTVPGWTSLVGAGLIVLSTALIAIPNSSKNSKGE